MSSSPADPSTPIASPPSPSLQARAFQTSTPNYIGKKQIHAPLNVVLPPASPAPATPFTYGENTITPPPRSPGAAVSPAGDSRHHAPDGTSSDKSSETAVGVARTPSAGLSRKESYKAQRQHYRREKKRAASALLHSIEDPSVIVLADWLKVRGSLKSWTKLWCVLKPGILLLYKSPKAKSSHWVGTVLLTSCQVIERPSKKDGFCFKLYHPLEQSIWAPRGPHNETIGAVVQPLPTAHLIFRAPSPAAGHCWLDGLELALRCSNAMLRCSRTKPEQAATADEPETPNNLSHEELERHFNEHDYMPKQHDTEKKITYATPKKTKPKKRSKWAQFVESIEILSKEFDSSDSSQEQEKTGFLDFLKKKDYFERNTTTTSSFRTLVEPKSIQPVSKSLVSSPLKFTKNPVLKCFELPRLTTQKDKKERDFPNNFIEDNLIRFMTSFPKRRSSTPGTLKPSVAQGISQFRESGAKTDSEEDFLKRTPNKFKGRSEVICQSPENIIITKTAPSVERFARYSSSSTDEVRDERMPSINTNINKFSLINYENLPSTSFERQEAQRQNTRVSSQNVYVAGRIVARELAGAASDTDSDGSRGMTELPDQRSLLPMPSTDEKKNAILERIEQQYTEDLDRDIGQAGELVEEVAEENKSLLWFLLKQVRPGMDLSKVVLPTFILEPRSFLDKLSDSYYHADLLAQAKDMEDPYQRFKSVLRWYLSGLYKKPKGLKKPYNPVLGEVFRCCWQHPNGSYTFYVSEQVSHHPPMSAFYISNRKEGYVIEGSLLAKSKFYGNSTSAILEGCARVHLLNFNEVYVTTAPYAHCKGIVIGTLSMELGGKVQIICESTGYHAEIEFKLRSFLSGAETTNSIGGRIKKGKETLATVEGYWDGKIDIRDKKTGVESNLLDVSVLKEQRMTRYLMKLENQQEFESQRLWHQVSLAIANDDQVAATEAKTVIEEAQRNRNRSIVAPYVPKYFHRDEACEPPEGIPDQKWKYNYSNPIQWAEDELLEYEEEFVIQTLCRDASSRRSVERARARTGRHDAAAARRQSDSDSRDDVAVKGKSRTTLKHTLHTIDIALREQTLAIERLQKAVESISESQKAVAALRPQNMGRMPASSHSWDLFAGFVLALILQTLLNWLFQQKD